MNLLDFLIIFAGISLDLPFSSSLIILLISSALQSQKNTIGVWARHEGLKIKYVIHIWFDFNWIELNWIELNWIELNWIELKYNFTAQ